MVKGTSYVLAIFAPKASGANEPSRAMATCIPIASAISFPLNHFATDFDTVIPAYSTPTPNTAKPNPAQKTWVVKLIFTSGM